MAFLLVLFSPIICNAQRQKFFTDGFWGGYFTGIHLNKKYTIVTELEAHTKQWLGQWHEQVLDAGVIDKLNEKWRIGSGGAYYRNAQYLNQFFFKNEWRLWQYAGMALDGKRLQYNQNVRIEERWVQEVSNGQKIDRYDYVTRLRYRNELQWPLRRKTIVPLIAEEFMFNPTYAGTDRFLDQNRITAGVNFKLAHTITLQCHYLKIFRWQPTTLEDENVIRINFVQQFN